MKCYLNFLIHLKNQTILPNNFLEGFSKKSKFFIAYDRYIFNSYILKQDQLFGFIRKKLPNPYLKMNKKLISILMMIKMKHLKSLKMIIMKVT